MNQSGVLPEPPIEADVFLGGFDRIDMPIDWLNEDWALDISAAGLGVMFRLYGVSLRQSPAGSLPGDEVKLAAVLPASVPREALDEALTLWVVHSDGRRYWTRVVPFVEDAWSRRRGKTSKDAIRKRRERLCIQLRKCGLSEVGAANGDVQAQVMDEIPDSARMTFQVVFDAATQAGVIGPVRPMRSDKNGLSESVRGLSNSVRGQSTDSPRTVHGQSTDSPRTENGQSNSVRTGKSYQI